MAKKSNFGTLIRTANALGVSEVLIVGRKAYYKFGARDTLSSTRRVYFYTVEEACSYLRKRDCTICGVEITDHAVSAENQPFRGSTGFMVGNEGTGLTEQQIALCDQIVYVPQYGTGASLNVGVATAIILHEFAIWAGFEANRPQEQKFIPS